MSGFRCASAAVAVTLALAAGVRAGEGVEIEFRFEDGAESSYDVSLDLDVTSTAELSGQKLSTSAKTVMKLVMETATRAAENAPPEVALTFSGLEVDQTIEDLSGKIRVEIRGSDVKVEKGSRYVINTEKDLGKELAGTLLAEFAFVGQEGTLVMDPSGRVAEVRGPKGFTEFLAAASGPGLFVLESPEAAVEVGETWQGAPSEIRTLKGLDLSANPLAVQTSFTLEGVEEEGESRIARITVKSPLEESDISANVLDPAGEKTHVVIRKLTRSATGVVLFDLDRGLVAESDLDVTITVEMEIEREGEKARHEVTGTAKIATKLRPVVEEDEAEEAGDEAAEGGEAKGEKADEKVPTEESRQSPFSPD